MNRLLIPLFHIVFLCRTSCCDTRSIDASGASFLCFSSELLYVHRDTARYVELRSPSVIDDNDGDADDRRGYEREQEVSLHEMHQRLQSQGWADLPSEIRVLPEAAIQLSVLRLPRQAYLERASTRAELPPW